MPYYLNLDQKGYINSKNISGKRICFFFNIKTELRIKIYG